MKNSSSEPLSLHLAAELAALEAMSETTIDTSDAPDHQDWSDSETGRFYKPRKMQKTLRIDADVLAWFEAQGPGHLTRMNEALRRAMLTQRRDAKPKTTA